MARPLNLLVDPENDTGIKYALLEGYPKISGSYSETTAVEEILIRATDFPEFIQNSFPRYEVDLNGFVVRFRERRRLPGAEFLVAQAFTAEPFTTELPGDPFDTDDVTFASHQEDLLRVRLDYAVEVDSYQKATKADTGLSTRSETNPVTFVRRRIDVGGEFLTIEPAKSKIAAGDINNDQGIKESNPDRNQTIIKVVPAIEMSFNWDHNPDPDWANIFDLLGKVNNEAAEIFYALEKETVLFVGVSAREKFLWLGPRFTDSDINNRYILWEMDFKFSGRRIRDRDSNNTLRTYGWNHVYSPKKGEFVRVKRGDSNAPLYESADLTTVFKAKTP